MRGEAIEHREDEARGGGDLLLVFDMGHQEALAELLGAFRTTLEELREADLLIHVVDASAADVDVQISAVVKILQELNLASLPRTLVFNKCDRLPPHEAELLCRRYQAIGVSAFQPPTLEPLLNHLERELARAVPSSPPVIAPDTVALASRA